MAHIKSVRSLTKTNGAFIARMECALVAKFPEGPDWTYEVKLDGYRAIAVKTNREAILYSMARERIDSKRPGPKGTTDVEI